MAGGHTPANKMAGEERCMTWMDDAMIALRPWIGRVRTVEDDIGMMSVRRVASTFDVDPDSIKRGELWAGSPAKLMRPLTEKEIAYFVYSARHYAELAQTYRSRG